MKIAKILLVAVATLLGQAIPASADPAVDIDENGEVVIVAHTPGSPGRNGGKKPRVSSGETKCMAGDREVPCSIGEGSFWHAGEQCYALTIITSLSGLTTCVTPYADVMAGEEYFKKIRLGDSADVTLPDPGQLARTAVATFPHTIEQDPKSLDYVKWNTWLWNADTTESSTGPITRSVTAGNYTVTATATLSKVVWQMGDGDTVTCTTATPWNPKLIRNEPSPDCGYVYQKDGEYAITATSHWHVTWTAPGTQGTLNVETNDTATLIVAEAHTLNIPPRRR